MKTKHNNAYKSNKDKRLCHMWCVFVCDMMKQTKLN